MRNPLVPSIRWMNQIPTGSIAREAVASMTRKPSLVGSANTGVR
ncbi:MAG: hypothetical protein WEE03_08240 [Chloroflexota bacterium]